MASLLRLWSFGMRFYCFIALWLLQLPLFLCLTVSLPQPVVMLCSNVSRVANTIHHAAGVVRVVGRLRVLPEQVTSAFALFSRFYTFYDFSYTFELLSLLLLPRTARCSTPHLRLLLCAILSLPPTQLSCCCCWCSLYSRPLLLYALAISCLTCWAFLLAASPRFTVVTTGFSPRQCLCFRRVSVRVLVCVLSIDFMCSWRRHWPYSTVLHQQPT